jgi:hypothetical protein
MAARQPHTEDSQSPHRGRQPDPQAPTRSGPCIDDAHPSNTLLFLQEHIIPAALSFDLCPFSRPN